MKVGWIDKLEMPSFNHDPHLPLFYNNISRKKFLEFKQIFKNNNTIMLRFF
jgi:hypothetical protein